MVAGKRSQMELFGLAIIVVLILIATIFVARFFINKDESSPRKGYVESEQATSMIKAILNTNSGCSNLKFSDVFKKCAESFPLPFGCTPDNACEFLKEKMEGNIFKETFNKWNMNYQLDLYKNGGLVENLARNGDCKNSLNREESDFPIRLSPSSEINIRLIICS